MSGRNAHNAAQPGNLAVAHTNATGDILADSHWPSDTMPYLSIRNDGVGRRLSPWRPPEPRSKAYAARAVIPVRLCLARSGSDLRCNRRCTRAAALWHDAR